MSYRIAYNCKYDSALVGFATEAGQAAWSGLGSATRGIVCAGRKVVKQSGNWETEMDRLSASGAIAGSKELWTCRAAVAPLPRTAPPRPDGRASLSPDPASPAARDPRGCSSPFPRRSSLWRRLRPRENAATLLRGPRACLALLAATALLALAAPAQAQTEVWSATLTPGDLSSGILGCSNGVGTARCSSTSVLSEDSFTYDSTAYNITGLFVRSNGQLEFIVDVDLTTTTLADLTLVVGSTSLVLSGGTASGTVKLIFSSSGVSLTAGTDITVKLTAPGTPNTAATGAPTITGTAQVGKTLTAVTTGITDADGLTSPTYTYQWIRVDGTDEEDISGENSSTYTLVDADLGKTIKVKVSFTDDASNAETLTSAATVTVAADTTPPEVESVTVDIGGSDVYLVFDEDLDVTAGEALLSSAFSLTVAGQAVTIHTYSVHEAEMTLTVQSGTIKQGQTVVVSYNDPTAGDDTVALQDLAGNDVASFTTGMSGVPAVTNDSTVVNTAPTAANKTVTTAEDRAYTFTADDFGFMDADTGDTLASVKIVTPPALGTLALDGTAVLADGVVTKAQIDGDMLTFRPAQDAHGDPYTTFTFKVNDGTDDSASAYMMTIDVTDAPAPVCASPSFGDRREIWSGTLTVGPYDFFGPVTDYGFDSGRSIGSLLPSSTFAIGSNNYTIDLYASAAETTPGNLALFLHGGAELTATEKAALRMHVCDEVFDFSTAGLNAISIYGWTTANLDWSPPVVTRTVYLSLPANNDATGEPAISGTARAEQVLTADASPIMDTDGLTDVDFTYQWIRVDADGTSNEEDITGEIAATYTLTTADVDKKVKVKVSFTDELSGVEERTSAAYPSSGTVTVAGPNTAPTAANNTVTTGEDRPYAFMAGDFGFADTDTGDTLASVKIVTPPALGTLALDGTAVLADDVVTKAQIDADMLTFRPAQDAHGDAYTTFTFKVNDGTVDSASAYTMTIDVTDAPAPVCAAPSFGDRREIWSGTVTVEEFSFMGTVTGYGFQASTGISSLLPSNMFSIGSSDHTISAISVGVSGTLIVTVDANELLPATEEAALRLHVCDENLDFSAASAVSAGYAWTGTLDWSPPVVTRTVYLSLPANNVATGEPAITGTAQAGQDLTADASPILDTDGLTGVELHLPVGAGGRGRHVQPGGHHRRDRRHLHPDRRRRGQEDQGEGELHRRAERRGGAHQRGVSLVRHGHRLHQHHRAHAAQRHGDLNAAQDDGHLRRARAHRVLDDLRRAGDGNRRSDLRLRPRRPVDGVLVCGLGHHHAAVLPRRERRVKRRPGHERDFLGHERDRAQRRHHRGDRQRGDGDPDPRRPVEPGGAQGRRPDDGRHARHSHRRGGDLDADVDGVGLDHGGHLRFRRDDRDHGHRQRGGGGGGRSGVQVLAVRYGRSRQ